MTREKIPLYRAIASAITACEIRQQSGNGEWLEKHRDRAQRLVRDHMPRGTALDVDTSTGECLVFRTSFYHVTESGSFEGRSEYTVHVTASLYVGIRLRIAGPLPHDAIAAQFGRALTALVEEGPE
jgi:hypothetical protein